MNKLLYGATALAAVLGAAAPAHATEGWYGQGNIGYSFDGSVDGDIGGIASESDLDDDWMASGALGHAFDNGFRLEGELSYRGNDLEDAADGEATAWGALLNLIYDFNREGTIQPYVGAGVGVARVSIDSGAIDEEDTVLAYQAMAGVGFALSERLVLDLGYRYFAAPEGEYEATPLAYDADYDHHAAVIGLRWQFAAPPPPPPPPAPPPVSVPPPPPPVVCPAADFTVYFEWDRADLNQAALETIDAAVERARNCNLGAVTVTGHTDTSGSADYNIGLSERRASVVRDALVARGLPAGGIATSARGETELARATNDGVREPLNRRTAVTISFN